MSGTRNDPPISTSSPRDTITARPAASAASATRHAAALLLTTSASSAPVSSRNAPTRCPCRDPRSPCSRSYSRFAYPRATSPTASIAAAASGARPRFVCSTTPVALMTGRNDGRASSAAAAATSAAGIAPSEAAPATIADRCAATARRAASTTAHLGAVPSPAASSTRTCTAGSVRSRSEAAISRRSVTQLCFRRGRTSSLRAARRAPDPRDRRVSPAQEPYGSHVHDVRRVRVHGLRLAALQLRVDRDRLAAGALARAVARRDDPADRDRLLPQLPRPAVDRRPAPPAARHARVDVPRLPRARLLGG